MNSDNYEKTCRDYYKNRNWFNQFEGLGFLLILVGGLPMLIGIAAESELVVKIGLSITGIGAIFYITGFWFEYKTSKLYRRMHNGS